MSEVKRYGRIGDMVEATDGLLKLYPMMSVYVLADDFDRVTAELQRQLDHKEQQRESELRNGQAGDRLVGSRSAASNWQDVLRLSGEVQRTNDKLYAAEKEREALQQRLTAADELADVLEGRVSMLLRELQELINDEDGILVAAELSTGFVWHALQKHGKAIISALKTTESQQCQFPQTCPSNCGCHAPLKPTEGGGDEEMTDADWQLKDDMERYDDEKEQP